ncbi:MAG: hypothetical protein GY804_11925 [Alphaproteobacteria bacterium]|nr:hypothetical protein [Alphaproteobacteria bacterium]
MIRLFKLIKKRKNQGYEKHLTAERREKEQSIKDNCTIEYYPLSKKYYPKYRGQFMNIYSFTGNIVELATFMCHGKGFVSERGARELLNKYIEQQFSINTISKKAFT